MPLTDLACRKSQPRQKLYKLSDMGGLQLWVYPHGSKLWRLAYRFSGKQKLLAIGKFPDISLVEARAAREQAKEQLRASIDPMHRRKIEKIEREGSADNFEVVAKEYIEKLRREGRAQLTLDKLEWLLSLATPVLGPMAVGTIRPIHVLGVLRKVESKGHYETARRLRSTIGAVCRYAVATARAEADPTLSLKGAITKPKVTSRAAITTPKEFGALLRSIDAFDGHPATRMGLQLMALMFPRPGELRGAVWPEFDLETAIWTIPAARAKMRRSHSVPLSRQALAILENLKEVAGSSQLVLHSAFSARKPLSENTMNVALRRIGYTREEMTSHGFRASAATLLNEVGIWNADAIERQLAHVEGNNVRRAYTRGEHWDERVKMMQWWADYLDQLRGTHDIVAVEVRSSKDRQDTDQQ